MGIRIKYKPFVSFFSSWIIWNAGNKSNRQLKQSPELWKTVWHLQLIWSVWKKSLTIISIYLLKLNEFFCFYYFITEKSQLIDGSLHFWHAWITNLCWIIKKKLLNWTHQMLEFIHFQLNYRDSFQLWFSFIYLFKKTNK